MGSTVALVGCGSYDAEEVYEAVGRGLELLGGIQAFVAPGESVLLKPNMLVAAPAEACVTTHPSVFEAVARYALDAGASVTYGDSPGFGRPESVARKAGLAQVAERRAVPLADFTGGRDVAFPDGQLIRQWVFANGVLDADGIISLPKMKTHGLTRVTCAVKNPFGCIPGIRKGEFHARLSDESRFAQMLVDLNRCLGVRLHVCDAVTAMEGNGPRNGSPRQVNAIVLSTDPVALDAVVCALMNLDVSLVGTCTYGEQFGLGTATDIEVVGDDVAQLVVEDFDVNRRHGSVTGGEQGRTSRFLRRFVVPKPVIDTARCTACGTCVKVCPVEPKAVDWVDGESHRHRVPVHDYDRCIRCYCCQEMCPDRAIEIVVPPLGRLIHR